VLLPTLADVVAKVAYTVANPVAAGLVDDPSQWPGVLFWQPGKVVAHRPDVYFDPNGSAPDSVELTVSEAPGVDVDEWIRQVTRAVAEQVERARQAVREQGLAFLGAAAVKAKSFLEKAKSYEVKRSINPVLAARDVSVRKTLRRILREFQRSYAQALAAWRSGNRAAVFPFGTWWMRVHHGAGVAPAFAG
jgi:hypothetical protein